MKFFRQLRNNISSWIGKATVLKFRKFPEWKLGKQIGFGGFATVHLLKKGGQKICLKAINTDDHPEATDFFWTEIDIQKQLKHPNIIELMDAEITGNFMFMFMEYAAGGTLLSRLQSNDSPMTLLEAHRYFRQLIEGVEYMHQRGIAHRDLKPENLLIDDRGNLKIADFGFAVKCRQGTEEVPLTDFCGTETYMAPEIYSDQYGGEAADVWSCGIILVNLLTGLEPWPEATMDCPLYASWAADQETPCQPWVLMDVEAVDLVKEMLHPHPQQRATVAEIKDSDFFRSISALR